MSTTVFIAVLGAALLHAGWNALVKGGRDKHLAMAAVVIGHAPFACAVLPFVSLPDASSLPFLFAGIALHLGYQFVLLAAYGLGDLTHVYPIARGSAPLIVAGVSVLVLGEQLTRLQLLAVLLIALGIASLSLVRQRDGRHDARAAALALITGCFIASYSLVDGLGARLAGTALGFYGWLSLGNAVGFALVLSVTSRRHVLARLPSAWRLVLLGGGASFAAYALVVWSFTQAPIALVTALRETSIVFALLIGVIFLREPLNLVKVLSTMATLCGAVLMRFARS